MIGNDEERAPGVFGMFAQEIQQGQPPKGGKGLQKVHRDLPATAPVSVITPPSPTVKPKPAQKVEADARTIRSICSTRMTLSPGPSQTVPSMSSET